jgi:O-acetyl-ADP-ribose deacetylase (regulator of RNase III)
MARSIDNDFSEVHFKQGSCSILLKQGDLMNENDVDVIVIPTPEFGRQTTQNYPLFEALRSKADQNLNEQIKKFSSRIKRGDAPEIILAASPSIILTTTPYLENKKIAIKMLKDTYLACLNLASSKNCETIAFPTIGCGQSGFSTSDAAETLYNALTQFGQSQHKQFKEIRIIVFKNEIYREFTGVFRELGRGKSAKIKLIDTYELLHSELCFTFDSLIVHLSNIRFISIFILDHQKSQDQPRCHQEEMKNQHHKDILTKHIHRSNDY